MNRVPVTITIQPSVLRRVDSAAEKMNMTRSAFVESVLRSAVAEAGGVASVMENPKLRSALYSAFAAPGVLETFAQAFQSRLTRDEAQQVLAFMSSGAPKSPKRRKA